MPVEIWAQYGTTGLLILFTTALLATLRAVYERERVELRRDLTETKTLLSTSTESNRTSLATTEATTP